MALTGLSDMSEAQDMTELRPLGSLALPPPRELITAKSLPGAYDPAGCVVEDTLRISGAVPQRRDQERLPERLTDWEVVEAREEPVVWGGTMAAHYGHFLIESAGRVWPLLPGGELEGLPVVFTTPLGDEKAREWLDALSAPRVELPAHGAVRFTHMYVPEPAWRMDAWAAPELRQIHLHVGRNLKVPKTSRCGVLWISRSRLLPTRIAYDERLLEWVLDPHVRRIHPEEMTLAEQVGALDASDAVVGVIGSAFHTLLMVSDPPSCIYLCPDEETTHGFGGRFQATYPLQDQILGTESKFMYALENTRVNVERLQVRPDRMFFPAGFRLLIPEILRALSESVLPDLRDDPRAVALMDPGKARPGKDGEIELAAARVLLDPLSIETRTALGRAFEAEGLVDCAREQLTMVADLTETDHPPGP